LEYTLPDTVYKRVITIVRDYDRRKEQYDNLPTDDIAVGFVKGNATSVANNAERIGILRAEIAKELDAVNHAIRQVPVLYRKGVLYKVKHNTPYPDGAHRNTYTNYKRLFMFVVAEGMGWV